MGCADLRSMGVSGNDDVANWRKDDRNSQLPQVVREVLRRAVRSSRGHSPFLRKRTSRMSHLTTRATGTATRTVQEAKQPILIAVDGSELRPSV